MKKILSLLLTLCLLLGALPTQALAFAGDIWPAGETVQTVTLDDGSLSLQNEYIHVTLRKLWGTYAYFTVVPAAKTDEENLFVSQTPYCDFITYGEYGKKQTEGVVLTPEKEEFVTGTPNDPSAKAIKVEYSLLTAINWVTAKATVYYELVQLKENGASSNDTWGVLASVGTIRIDEDSLPKDWNRDFMFTWGYSFGCFTAMGHVSNSEKPGGPAIKMSQTTVPEVEEGEPLTTSTESSVFTASVEDLSTKTVPKGYSEWGDVDGVYITEVYTDGYPWANPFVGLSDYYEKEITSSGSNKPIRVALAQTVSVRPGDEPLDTWVECESYSSFTLDETDGSEEFSHFLWGFHDLTSGTESVPSEPDAVDPAIYAKRLAAFANGSGGVTVESVTDDAALAALKQQYGEPVALINGDYESKNGADFTFTGGAVLLSPSVTATWGDGGKFVIHRDGRVEQSGVSLNAPSFKFYQPESGAEDELTISLTKDGFAFGIDPDENDAIVYVDIPYATVRLENAATDAAGNLVFGGAIGFRTIFSGAEFSLEKLGYGLNEKNEFKVNGVHATGNFDTEKLMTLELAKIEGEVNTFKGEERYAFELELNVFDLFETEATLALERSKKDGSLIPDELWFYVKADPGIPLVPPIPIGQLNGGGAGFKDLAATVNGDYFAIPPLKLRGALTGTYLHLIQGTGNVVLGPSEISLKATDVGLVGVGKAGQVIDSFGYSLQLNGQERTYNGTTYKGIYFGGSEELALNLPSKTIDIFEMDTAIKLGAFGGVNDAKNCVYLGVGANGTVKSRVQIPSDVPVIGGWRLGGWDVDLIVGGQTTFPIKNVSVSEGMKLAFRDIDLYLGAMTGVYAGIIDARLWVLVPNIVKTDFRRGGGWDVETKWFGRLPEWDWSEKGVEPVVQSTPLEDGTENTPVLYSAKSFALKNSGGENTETFTVTAGTDETPYILLAFEKTVTEEQIKASLFVTKQNSTVPLDINWLTYTAKESEKGMIDETKDINAATDIIKNKDDGKDYRVAILRLSEGGTYVVNTGALELVTGKSQGVSVAPFEELDLTLTSNQVSGKIKYAEENTEYVLRTYFASEKGGADYLIDEQPVADPTNISVDIPTQGTLVPTGSYYVTSFLMTEKSVESTNESGEKETLTGLVAIDNTQFGDKISYTNTQQPKAPTSVTLEATGNEVMRAEWTAVKKADGYRVTIYQKQNGAWVDTGFGYDLDANATSIDMALTVGGEETTESKNLSANETYKVGVSAYKETEDGAKYYSAETESTGEYLPEYTPLDMTLRVNSEPITADENGVYHVYAGGEQSSKLTVSCATEGVTYQVTRMDTNNKILPDAYGEYAIPDFTGTLMLKIDGVKGKDVTSVFLLVSMDKTPPVLTLSDPIFYADRNTGAYIITGTADAGSQILYSDNGGDKSVYAAGDGSFTINGTLDERETSVSLYLRAQDSAGNRSKLQLALVARQAAEHSVTVNTDGNGTASASLSSAAAGTGITLTAAPNAGYHFKEWQVEAPAGLVIANDRFTMPDGNVEIRAIFEEDTPTDPAKPDISVTGTYTYNGSEHTAAVTGYDPATMDISGNTGTDAGDYTVSVTSKTGKWADGSADAVTAAWSIGKATQEAHTELSGVAPSAEGSSDGKIIGVTDKMEYRMAGESNYTACSGTEIENLPAGTYFVRYAEDKNHFASSDTVVTVGAGAPLEDRTITFHGNGGSGSMRPVTVKTGTNYILPTCGFTAPADQEFKAWEIGGTEYEVGACYTVNEDTAIRALWKNSVIIPATYTVTVSNDGNGMVTASPATAVAGTEITLTAAPNAGYHFKEWQVISPAGLVITNNKFTMPDGSVEVKAIFEKDAPPVPTEYTVTFDGNGGTPSVGSMTTTDGKLASLPDASRRGSYSFDGWYTEKSGGTKVTTATVFSANTTVYAHWTYTGNGYNYYTIKATAGAGGSISPYGDVSVREGRDQTFTITPNKGYAVSNVKIDGKSIGAVKSYTFENVSRTHSIEVFFMKANGNPQTGVFVDAATGSYYEDAVDRAAKNNITQETNNTRFSPDGICTRAQAVTFLRRRKK